MKARRIAVPLTPEDHAEARTRATFFVERVHRSQAMTRNARGGESRDRTEMMRNDILGALGQCVVAKQFGLPWIFDKDGFKNPDVGPFYVRTTVLRTGSLIFRPEDTAEDAPWILAYVESLEAVEGTVLGWLFGKEIKRTLYWRDDVRAPAWFAPAGCLRSLTDPLLSPYLPPPTQTGQLGLGL